MPATSGSFSCTSQKRFKEYNFSIESGQLHKIQSLQVAMNSLKVLINDAT